MQSWGSRFADRPAARSPRAVTARPAAMLRAALTSALHRPAVQESHSKTAWLLRFPAATCPHAEHRCDVYAAGICSTRPQALCCKRAPSSPQPLRPIARFSPRFCATRTPGCSTVPRAERVIARTSRASILIVSKRRAISVVTFSTQSLRRSASRAFSFAIALLVRTRRLEPRLARASRCCSTVNRFDSPAERLGARSNSPVDSAAATATPRSMPTTLPSPGPVDRVGDVGERDMPAAGPITGNPVGLDPLRHRPRQPKPHPAHLGHPHPTKTAVQPHDVMRLEPDLPKPFMHTGLAPRRPPVRAGKEVVHGLREIPQRLLLHGLTPGTKPPVRGADLRQLRSLLDIARSLTARLPMLLLLHRQIPHIPRIPAVPQQRLLLLRARQQPEPRHIRKVTSTTDIPDVARPPHTRGPASSPH